LVVTKLADHALVAEAVAVVLHGVPRQQTSAAYERKVLGMTVGTLYVRDDAGNENGTVRFADGVKFAAILASKLH
jgi:hypothetical protein